MNRLSSRKIASKQKKLLFLVISGCLGLVALLVFFTLDDDAASASSLPNKTADASFSVISQEVDAKTVRIAALETRNDALTERLETLERSLQGLQEDNAAAETQQQHFADEALSLSNQLQQLEKEIQNTSRLQLEQKKTEPKHLKAWDSGEKKDGRHVSFEIPAGTVVKAVLISGADCSVAVQKPTGPNMVLLRPLDQGNLPRNVRVPLKGSVIIGNAIGDISSERVYIRAERMSLVERDGSFVETELSAYVSGEDGREGMRGVVVDRSGQIVARAAFAAFLQGAGQGAEAALNAKAFEKMADKYSSLEMLRYGPIQGGTTALNKMTDYYIKRAEQLQPAIQVAAGRVVDIIFTRTVKIGEKNLKKKLDMERESKRRQHE